jgi:hypothetical protein
MARFLVCYQDRDHRAHAGDTCLQRSGKAVTKETGVFQSVRKITPLLDGR